MKFIFGALVCLLISFEADAHAYFFGFAEVSYNSKESVYEGTLILSTHDVEEWLQQKEIPLLSLEEHTNDLEMYEYIELELFEGFQIKTNGTSLLFELIGYEVLENGMTQFYFHSQKTEKGTQLDITFDLMMNEFPQQQNKINYIENNQSYTAVFIAEQKQSIISIE